MDANAPAASVPQVADSAIHSASVGTRYPLGQGLFVPLTPCHKLSFCELRQFNVPLQDGILIKLELPGVSVDDNEEVVEDVLN